MYDLREEEDLFHFGLGAGFGVHFHDHDVFHVFVPFVDDGAFGLVFFGVGDALFALEVAKELVAYVPDGVVFDTGGFV